MTSFEMRVGSDGGSDRRTFGIYPILPTSVLNAIHDTPSNISKLPFIRFGVAPAKGFEPFSEATSFFPNFGSERGIDGAATKLARNIADFIESQGENTVKISPEIHQVGGDARLLLPDAELDEELMKSGPYKWLFEIPLKETVEIPILRAA